MKRAAVVACLQLDGARHEINSSWELLNFSLRKDEALLSFFGLLFFVVCCVSSLQAFCRLPSVPVTRGGPGVPVAPPLRRCSPV